MIWKIFYGHTPMPLSSSQSVKQGIMAKTGKPLAQTDNSSVSKKSYVVLQKRDKKIICCIWLVLEQSHLV